MGYSVFVSHSAADREWARWIAANAQPLGISVYLFEHDPQPGVLVADKIQAAIKGSDALIVLLTTAGATSAYVQQEIGFARAAEKLVIPLIWPDVQKPNLAMLEGREWIQFDPETPEPTIARLFHHLNLVKTQKEGRQALLAIGALMLIGIAVVSGEGPGL